MDVWEQDAVSAEVDRLSTLAQTRKPPYADRLLSQPTPGAEALGAPREDGEISHATLIKASLELAEKHAVPFTQVRDQLLLAHQRAADARRAVAGHGRRPGRGRRGRDPEAERARQ
jgi:hypothetical protein